MSLTRKAASNLACPARCWVLPVVCLHGCGAWSRSMVAERRHGQCTKKTLRLFRKDGRGRGGRGGGDFLERGGLWSVLKTLALGRVPSTPPSPDPLEECPATPPPPPRDPLKECAAFFLGEGYRLHFVAILIKKCSIVAPGCFPSKLGTQEDMEAPQHVPAVSVELSVVSCELHVQTSAFAFLQPGKDAACAVFVHHGVGRSARIGVPLDSCVTTKMPGASSIGPSPFPAPTNCESFPRPA